MRKYLNQIHSFQKISLLDAKSTGRFWWRSGGPLFCQRCWSARWKFAPCLYMIFTRQSSIVAFENLEGCVAFPTKQPKRMHRCCFRHNVRMLWHCQIGFWDCLDRGLCLCRFFVLVALQIFCLGTKYSDKKIVCVLSRSENPAFQ